jgi:hypothetical protein
MHIPSPRYVADGPTHVKYESEQSYTDWLNSDGFEASVPGYTSTAAGQTTHGAFIDGSQLWVKEGTTSLPYQQTMSVALLNIADGLPEQVSATSIIGWNANIYASAGAMYLSSPYSQWDPEKEQDLSDVVKFTLGSDAVTLAASARVPGNILNSFSMDESGQYFRIATSDGWRSSATNSVFVLDQVASELQRVGSIQGIAPGEALYSARFIGDRGYLVTFERRDPLFTLDLSNPTAPKVAGELIIPGFSSYLQPIDATHLLGLGQNINDSGFVGDAQLSLFDVSDIANPKRTAVHTVDSGESTTDSVADADHHAFAYFPAQGILAFPVREYAYAAGDYQARTEVVRVETEEGFTRLGGITHPGYNWSLRAVRIGQTLFSVSDAHVIVTELEHPETILKRIDV